ncbi:MAG: DUF3047 domain-containing protein [Salinibacter sp.]
MSTSLVTMPISVFARWAEWKLGLWGALVLLGVTAWGGVAPAGAQSEEDRAPEPVVVEDFEGYEPGTFPDRWVFVSSDERILSYEEVRDEGETMEVEEEGGNQFVRLITEGEALRYTLRNEKNFDWDLREHPYLEWRWRALHLPEGASEKDQNDTGGAIYVTFGTDWLGRPKSIKYTYSSTLPVGTVVSFGPLKAIVADSAQEPRLGEWKTKRQNVRQDYRQVFGEAPPNRPVSITLWGDSDTTGDSSRVDVDDIMLRP